MSGLIRPDIYDELVEQRRRVALLEEHNTALRDELRDERRLRNEAVAVAGAAWLDRTREHITIQCRLDPTVLRHAHNTREAFNLIVSRWFEELWAAYRKTELPKEVK